MHYAIIAAGLGKRLINEGINTPKPLIKIGQETLIHRLIRIFNNNDAEHIYIICNTQQRAFLPSSSLLDKITLITADTPSSMHSLFQLTQQTDCGKEPFCLTTIDTIFNEMLFKQYIQTFKCLLSENTQQRTSPPSSSLPEISENERVYSPSHSMADALFGITSFIHDEKPLYVQCDKDGFITAFIDSCNDCQTISAGIYGLTPKAIPILTQCIENGESRMRNFQRALLKAQIRIRAFNMGKVIDIDHKSDILLAEQMFKQ